MVKGFDIGDKNDASFYAGILIAAFALAEALTGMWWGSLSDRIGRKPVLLIGCFGTMISLLVVGFSTNFYIALLGRIGGGLLNGNAGERSSPISATVPMLKFPMQESSRQWFVTTSLFACSLSNVAQVGELVKKPEHERKWLTSQVC